MAEEDSIFEQERKKTLEKLGETSKMGLGKGGGVTIAFSIDLIMLGHSGFAR